MKRSQRQTEEGGERIRGRASERANDFLSSLVFGCVIALTKEAGNETPSGQEEGKHFVVCRALDEIARTVAVCPPNYVSQLDVQCHE